MIKGKLIITVLAEDDVPPSKFDLNEIKDALVDMGTADRENITVEWIEDLLG